VKVSKKRLRRIEKKLGVNVYDKMVMLYGVTEENQERMIAECKEKNPYVESVICYPPIDPNEPE